MQTSYYRSLRWLISYCPRQWTKRPTEHVLGFALNMSRSCQLTRNWPGPAHKHLALIKSPGYMKGCRFQSEANYKFQLQVPNGTKTDPEKKNPDM